VENIGEDEEEEDRTGGIKELAAHLYTYTYIYIFIMYFSQL
jgi:hypothetical protein